VLLIKRIIVVLLELLKKMKYIQVSQSCEKFHNWFVIKDINFFFFLDDNYASTAHFLDYMLNCESNLHGSFLLICHRF
jgi:hypothetical protein